MDNNNSINVSVDSIAYVLSALIIPKIVDLICDFVKDFEIKQSNGDKDVQN